MSDYWTTIGEIAEVYDGPHATPKKIDQGPYFLSISSLENGSLDLSKSAHLSEEDFRKWTKRVTPQEGDVLFSYETRLGDAALMPANITACLGRRMGLLRPNTEKVIPEYLLYAYLSPVFQETLRSKTVHGATVDRIALREVPGFPIRIPPKEEQFRVVGILNALSLKIELNRQINQTLEQIAQAIFKSWFVDFEPVKAKIAAKQNGQDPELAAMCAISGKTEEQLKGLDEAALQQLKTTAALFPDALVESELGEIPEGWEVTSLGNEIDFATGFAFKSQDFTENGVRLARGDNVKEGVFYWGDKSRYWPAVTQDIEKYLLKSGDVLIGMDGSKVGKNWVRVGESDLPCLLVQRVARLRFSDSIGSSMLEVMIGGRVFKQYVENVKTGTSIPHISGKQIKELPIIKPNDDGDLFNAYEILLEPQAKRREHNLAVNSNLSEIRDALLPKLLSGEVSLSVIQSAEDTVA